MRANTHILKMLSAVAKTLAYNHQILQSLLLSSSLTSSETLYDLTSTTCSREMFEILNTLGVDTERILFIKNLVYRGISYYPEQCVILSKIESDLIVGTIKVLLKRNTEPCLLLKKQIAMFIPALDVYHLPQETFSSLNNYVCINVGKLKNFYPLSLYTLNGKKIVVLKH